jgi:hypothetical protein
VDSFLVKTWLYDFTTNYPVPRSGGKTLLALRCSRIMAKQKHGHPDYRSQRLDSPKHRPPQPSGSLVYPSSSVLSILATIAASSQTADGSPLPLPTPPPSFLCPFIEHDSFQARALPSTATSTSVIYPTPSSSLSTSTTPSPKSGKFGQLADKFVQGDDGLWRKTNEWTLFGSTVRSFPHYPTCRLMRSSSAARLPALSLIQPKLQRPLPPYNQINLTLSSPLVGTRQPKPPTARILSLSCH